MNNFYKGGQALVSYPLYSSSLIYNTGLTHSLATNPIYFDGAYFTMDASGVRYDINLNSGNIDSIDGTILSGTVSVLDPYDNLSDWHDNRGTNTNFVQNTDTVTWTDKKSIDQPILPFFDVSTNSNASGGRRRIRNKSRKQKKSTV